MDKLPNEKIQPSEPIRFSKSSRYSNSTIKSDQIVTALPALGLFDWKMFIILLLLIIISLSYNGINILNIFGNAIQDGVLLLKPAVQSFLAIFGFSVGNTINTVSEVTANVAKNGIDIVDGTVHDVSNTLENTINTVSEVTANVTKNGIDIVDGTVHSVGNLMIGKNNIGVGPRQKTREPRPDSPEDTIQKSMSSAKSKWCLVGEFQNKRGCIDISESDKCMSGEIFPNEQMCIFGTPQFQINH